MSEARVAIIGGGLAGLYAAYRLHRQGIGFDLFEARDRLGGRILSSGLAGFDLGPSWFWPDFQPRMQALVTELGLPVFEQYSTGAMLLEDRAVGVVRRAGYVQGNTSMRIQGGTAQLVSALSALLPPEQLHLNAALKAVKGDGLVIEPVFANPPNRLQTYMHLWLALPPRLIAGIQFTPALPEQDVQTLMAVPTWMAAHAKYVAHYARPFWREAGLSGDAFSRIGPLTEVHDASNNQGAALFGFFGINAEQRAGLTSAEIKIACRAQLVRLFGEQAAAPIEDAFYDWAADPCTATEQDRVSSGEHGALDAQITLAAPWTERVRLIGSEAALEQGGYMEGALAAVDRVLAELDMIAS
ncbi:MAG: amine oxidase [Gammaproteobacteria bacterium HGW-Gammaproteobacteria-6]|nr:MAG: amine oxidase [Gammaproteobacteria bacterium HGW-Gammaproteobacteria-6]